LSEKFGKIASHNSSFQKIQKVNNKRELLGFASVATLPTWKGEVRGSNPPHSQGGWGGDA